MAAIDNDAADHLREYREKRRASETPEPFGTGRASGAGLFVVQQHSARRLHFDLRLEVDGVLKSWAVPKGPSYDQADKRLAVQTEDHPLDYADFEGIIPEGNYGAGAVIVWDRGRWIPKIPFEEGIAKGKLLFELRGYKLRGTWTLVKIAKGEKEWLLIKERDQWMQSEREKPLIPQSVLSGLTVEQLRDGVDPAVELQRDLTALAAPRRQLAPREIALTLAQTWEEPFSDPDWLFELKYDGYRLLASRQGQQALLLSRRGHDITATFPEIAQAVCALPYDHLLLDGEVVVHDERGYPSFARLQKRGRLTKRLEIRRAAIELPVAFYAFDLLGVAGYDLRSLPLAERKRLLQAVVPPVGAVRYVDHIVGQGDAMFDQVRAMGLEGMVAKKADGTYPGGRTDLWRKIRCDRLDDFVVVGFTAPKGSRAGIGALHLAAFEGSELAYAGRVGTGFSGRELDAVHEVLSNLIVDGPPCSGDCPMGPEHHWVRPELVCEVRYKEWTDGGLLRHPVFVRVREDKPPEDCLRPGGELVFGSPEPLEDDSPRPLVPFSNLDKVFWPEEGFTKGDLIDYYRSIAPWLLPYLANRPVVLTRFPDGIDGKSFFQKDAPGWVPEWVRTERVWSDDSGKETNYFICEDVESLLYVINLGSIPLHIWSSCLGTLERPDWCILDLDPKDAPFAMVVEVARTVRDLCDEIALPAYAKTSGSTGIHVLVPLGRSCTYAQCKQLGELLARVTASRIPDLATTARALDARKGRVYIDFLQNGHGKLLVSPFCVRPLPGAPVSMPVHWEEVNAALDLHDFTIVSAPERMQALREDPMANVLRDQPDLLRALSALATVVE